MIFRESRWFVIIVLANKEEIFCSDPQGFAYSKALHNFFQKISFPSLAHIMHHLSTYIFHVGDR